MRKAIERSLCILFCFVMLFSAALPVSANADEAGTDVQVRVEPFKILARTEDCALSVGDRLELSVQASREVSAYKWECSTDGGASWTEVASSATYTITSAQTNTPANVPYQYRVTITSPLGYTDSAVIRVLVDNDYAYKTITLRGGDTSVSAYVHKNTRLVVTPLEDDDPAAITLKNGIAPNWLLLLLYDVSLVNHDNQVVPYFGRVAVSFQVGSEYNTRRAAVVHLHGDPAATTTHEGIVTDGNINIVVDELSPFMVLTSTTDFPNTITASAGEGGSISPSGYIYVEDGVDKTFTFLPDEGYEINALTVNGAETAFTGNSYTLENITADTTLAVSFSRVTPSAAYHTVTINAPAHGSVYPSGDIQVRHGLAQTVYFYPEAGYELDTVTVDGTEVKVIGNCYTLSAVTADTAVAASFTQGTSQPPDVYKTIAASAGANGAISPMGEVNVEYGGDMYFYFIPDTDYMVDKVLVNNVETAVSDNYYHFVNVIEGESINVSFKPVEYTVTASAGAHGSISPSGKTAVVKGGSKTYTVTPDKNYLIDTVKVDGKSVTLTGNKYTFSDVAADHSITATFKAKASATPTPTPTATTTPAYAGVTYYTVTASAGPHGSINPSGRSTVARNNAKSFYIAPDEGYEIDTLKVDGKAVTAATYYSFYKVTGDHTISATFKKTQELEVFYNVSASSDENGSISPSGVLKVANGGAQSFYFMANEGYEVDTVYVNGEEQPLAGNRLALDSIDADTEISVTFKPVSAPDPADISYHCFICRSLGRNIAPWCTEMIIVAILALGGGGVLYAYKKRKAKGK